MNICSILYHHNDWHENNMKTISIAVIAMTLCWTLAGQTHGDSLSAIRMEGKVTHTLHSAEGGIKDINEKMFELHLQENGWIVTTEPTRNRGNQEMNGELPPGFAIPPGGVFRAGSEGATLKTEFYYDGEVLYQRRVYEFDRKESMQKRRADPNYLGFASEEIEVLVQEFPYFSRDLGFLVWLAFASGK
jgi:hypothetical protein